MTSPDGVQWHVGRVWAARPMPRWRRVHVPGAAREAAWWTPPDGDLEGLAAWLATIVAVFVVAVVLIPLLLFGIELLIVGLVIAIGVLARALLGRPWVVRAVPEGGHAPELAWRVSGWRRSGRVIDEVAGSLAAGLPPAPGEAQETILAATPGAA